MHLYTCFNSMLMALNYTLLVHTVFFKSKYSVFVYFCLFGFCCQVRQLRHEISPSFKEDFFHLCGIMASYSFLDKCKCTTIFVPLCILCLKKTNKKTGVIWHPAGFQLHCGSEGGAAQPAIRQSRAGHDQTV